MTRYFFAWLTFTFLWCIIVILFDGLESRESTYVTVLICLGVATVAYFLYPKPSDEEE